MTVLFWLKLAIPLILASVTSLKFKLLIYGVIKWLSNFGAILWGPKQGISEWISTRWYCYNSKLQELHLGSTNKESFPMLSSIVCHIVLHQKEFRSMAWSYLKLQHLILGLFYFITCIIYFPRNRYSREWPCRSLDCLVLRWVAVSLLLVPINFINFKLPLCWCDQIIRSSFYLENFFCSIWIYKMAVLKTNSFGVD